LKIVYLIIFLDNAKYQRLAINSIYIRVHSRTSCEFKKKNQGQ